MEKFIKFITNEKFYLPIVYIVVGLILYLVIEKVINRISKGLLVIVVKIRERTLLLI